MKTNRLCYVLQMNIKCDSDEACRWIKDRSVKYTQDLQEEKTLSFEWFVSQDGKEATLIKSFTDSDGTKQRAENLLASPIAQEWSERFEPTNWIIGGNVKQDLIDGLLRWEQSFINTWKGLTICHESLVKKYLNAFVLLNKNFSPNLKPNFSRIRIEP